MEPQSTAAKRRPGILTAIGIVSVVMTSLLILNTLADMFSGQSFTAKVMGSLMDDNRGLIIAILLITISLLGMKLWGVIKMLNLKRSGYVLYMIPCSIYILTGLIGLLIAGSAVFSTIGGIFSLVLWAGTILFMFLYGQNLKHMK
jgi:hypothetical protein